MDCLRTIAGRKSIRKRLSPFMPRRLESLGEYFTQRRKDAKKTQS